MVEEKVYATGKRKSAVARVWIIPDGKGNITVNGTKPIEYFNREDLVIDLMGPLDLLQVKSKYDIVAEVKGGGIMGQAGAIRLGIARALVKHNEEFHLELKKSGFLKRDDRRVERKKYGQPKARKRFQFSKR
ncbi:30S ribosomal protein S9 [bacterium]|nr:30S ribosomal protein S9 [bacterium]